MIGPVPLPSLDGRSFRDVSPAPAGDVGGETVFTYHEDADGTVWARYEGGSVRLGFLVGTRDQDGLDFRYAHVTDDGDTATGHRLHETWAWDSREGSGTSVVEEVPAQSSSDQC